MAIVTDNRNATDHALDLLFYAPLGLLTEAAAHLPEMAQKGRVQVGNAKVLGQFAVQFGKQRAEARLNRVPGEARSLLATWGLVAPDVPTSDGPTVGASTRTAPRAQSTPAEAAYDAPAVDELAIPDYDSLAASQVVARLGGLRPDELEDVRRYEASHRARKTIMGRIAQLGA